MKKYTSIAIICIIVLGVSWVISQYPHQQTITVGSPEVKLFPTPANISVSSNNEYEVFLKNARSNTIESPTTFSGDLWIREKSSKKEVFLGINSFYKDAAGNPVVSTMKDPSTQISYAFIDQGTGTSARGGTIVNFTISKALIFSYARNQFITKIHDRSYLVISEPSEFWQRLVDAAMHNIVVIDLDTLVRTTIVTADKYTTYSVDKETHTVSKTVFSHELIDGQCVDCYNQQTTSVIGKLEDFID